MMKNSNKIERLEIRLTKKEKDELMELVEESTFSSASELIRSIVANYIMAFRD